MSVISSKRKGGQVVGPDVDDDVRGHHGLAKMEVEVYPYDSLIS